MLSRWQRLWWNNLERIGKRQTARNKKLIKALLPKPARKRRNAAKAPLLAPPLNKRKSSSRKQAVKPPIAADAAPGKWLAGYFSSYPLEGPPPGPPTAAARTAYWLYLPSTLPSGAAPDKLPLVVMLHGCEQSATEFARGTRMNWLAEKNGFAVLYPQQSRKSHPHRCWHWYAPEARHGGGETRMIAGVIEKALAKYPLDASRVYVAGMSAGAALAASVALNYPQLVAAVGLHSGPVFAAADSALQAYGVMQRGTASTPDQTIRALLQKTGTFPPLPAILIHGMQDSVVRPVNLTQLVQQFRALRQLSAPAADLPPPETREIGSGDSAYRMQDYADGDRAYLRVCEVAQLEHAWSGGDSALRFNGPGPDASKLMWEFFSGQRRLPAGGAPGTPVPIA